MAEAGGLHQEGQKVERDGWALAANGYAVSGLWGRENVQPGEEEEYEAEGVGVEAVAAGAEAAANDGETQTLTG